LKSHIPSSATADAAQPIEHTIARRLSVCETGTGLNIVQHKTLKSARQLSFRRLATDPHVDYAPNDTKRPGISGAQFRLRGARQPTAAMAASNRMRRTTTTISANVNVPRVNTFSTAVIAIVRHETRLKVTKKKNRQPHAAAFSRNGDQLRDAISSS